MIFKFYNRHHTFHGGEEANFTFQASSVESAMNYILQTHSGLSANSEDGCDYVGNYISILSTVNDCGITPDIIIDDDSMKTITLYVSKMSSWSASDLMYLYSKINRGVYFIRDKYMTPSLVIEGKRYQCSKWTIRPDEENEDFEKVAIDLYEVKKRR